MPCSAILCAMQLFTQTLFAGFISSFHFSVLSPLCDFIIKENMFHEKKCWVRVIIESTGSEYEP